MNHTIKVPSLKFKFAISSTHFFCVLEFNIQIQLTFIMAVSFSLLDCLLSIFLKERRRLKERYPSLALTDNDMTNCRAALDSYQTMLNQKTICEGKCSMGRQCPIGTYQVKMYYINPLFLIQCFHFFLICYYFVLIFLESFGFSIRRIYL